jgi:hypothetical protein
MVSLRCHIVVARGYGLQGGGTPNLSPPTADEPVLFIQPYRPLNDPFESWWPTNWATRWDRRFVPMLPLNILGLESAENAPPHHLKKAARRYYDAFVFGSGFQPDPLTQCQLDEYHERMAVQIFNFGGDTHPTFGSIPNGDENTPTEFWIRDSTDRLQTAISEPQRWINPWMTQRLPLARTWMEGAMTAWTTNGDGSNGDVAAALPQPKGGMYFDVEMVIGGDGAEWSVWAEALESDGVRWSTKPVPDVTPQIPGTQTMALHWDDAKDLYHWTGTLASNIAETRRFSRVENRPFKLWLDFVMERALTTSLRYAAYEPIWATYPDLPIANYGDFDADNRVTGGEERFGWHLRRVEAGESVVPSRDGWLGSPAGGADRRVVAPSPAVPQSDPEYCDECIKYPYALGAQVDANGTNSGTEVGPWLLDHNRYASANLHAPVLYIPPTPESNPVASHASVNLYVPAGHPQRNETRIDASIREARYTLDSMDFSGVAPEDIAPWILPATNSAGFQTDDNVVYRSTREHFQRMLLLMRSKAIPRIQVFNLGIQVAHWNCIRDLYDEVYGPQYLQATATAGEPLSTLDVNRIKTTVTEVTGTPVTLQIASEVLAGGTSATTALQVDFTNVPDPETMPLGVKRGLRLVFECEVAPVLPFPGSSWFDSMCAANLRGSIRLWNYGTPADPTTGWVDVVLSAQEGTQYEFPACFAGTPFDLSMRRTLYVPYSTQYSFVSEDGAARVLFIHHTTAPVDFLSKWDLVQLAPFEPVEYCAFDGILPTVLPGDDSAAGAPTGADINFDGSVTAADLGDFSNAFSEAAPLADYNGDELVTSDDALTFLEDFVEQID